MVIRLSSRYNEVTAVTEMLYVTGLRLFYTTTFDKLRKTLGGVAVYKCELGI